MIANKLKSKTQTLGTGEDIVYIHMLIIQRKILLVFIHVFYYL